MKAIDMKKAIQRAIKTAKHCKYGDKCIADLEKCSTPKAIDKCLSIGQARKDAAEIAEDLRYSNKVIERIWSAESETQITNILIDARKSA